MKALLPLALVLAAPVLAQAPAGAPKVQVPGVSPAGIAILQKMQGQAAPEGPAIMAQQRALGQKMAAILSAPTIDLAKLEAAMKEKQALQAKVAVVTDTRLLAVLRALPAADRKPLLAAMLGAGQRPPAAPVRK